MAIDPTLRTKIEAELRTGKKARELSEKYDVPYVTIQGWKKKLDAEIEDEDVSTIVEADATTLHMVKEKLVEELPVREAAKVEKVVDGAIGLKRLEEKTQALTLSILNRVESYLATHEPTMKDLRDSAAIVSQLHTAMFNKNTTQVNVVNSTTINNEKLSMFKSALKA